MRKNLYIFLYIFLIFFLLKDILILKYSSYYNFYKIPILNDGRIKPMGVFAESNFKLLFEKELSKDQSVKWLCDIFFDQNNFYNKDLFFIKDKNVILNLGLADKTRFCLFEILDAFKKNFHLVPKLNTVNKNVLSDSQKRILEIYFKMLTLLDIGNSIDFLLPNIDENNNNFPFKSKYFYFSTKSEYLDRSIFLDLDKYYFNIKVSNFMLIPISDDIWMNTYNYFKHLNYKKSKELDILSNLIYYYSNNNLEKWSFECVSFSDYLYNKISKKYQIILNIEILYNKLNLIYKSSYMYLFSIIFLLFFKKFNKDFIKKLSFHFFVFGFILNFIDIILRIFLSLRPPVTSLYESIIFVNLIFTALLIFMIFKRKESINLFLIGAFFSFLLSFISNRIEIDSSNIKSLIAVLNTNFWLIIHVLTITIGYSLCLVTSFLSHIYLLLILKNKNKIEINFYNIIFTFSIFALFFSFIGTLLGGIWADQAWGRFWGWDPKENGALFIVLWLTLILHARISNIINNILFSIGMILNTIVLSLAWFGVNLLNVGLHSYGFIENIGLGIISFILFEISYILIFILFYRYKRLSNLFF